MSFWLCGMCHPQKQGINLEMLGFWNAISILSRVFFLYNNHSKNTFLKGGSGSVSFFETFSLRYRAAALHMPMLSGLSLPPFKEESCSTERTSMWQLSLCRELAVLQLNSKPHQATLSQNPSWTYLTLQLQLNF